jgi:dTDP-4-dehydrorhamnose 3,5-epimerase
MIELSGENKKQLLIPKWCAHGFISLDDNTEFVYKCDDFYNPNFEGGIAYNDPDLMIDWEKIFTNMNLTMSDIILAEKDKHHPTLQEFHSYNPF